MEFTSFFKKATVVVSLVTPVWTRKQLLSLKCPAIHPSILPPRAFREQRKKRPDNSSSGQTHTKNLVLSLPKNSFRWEVQGKWKLNVLINKTLLHVDRYFITVRSNTFHYVLYNRKQQQQKSCCWLYFFSILLQLLF